MKLGMVCLTQSRCRGGKTHKLKIGLNGLHYQANALWLHEFRPCLSVFWVAHSKVQNPVYSGGLGISYINGVVDVTLICARSSAVDN